MIMNKHRIFTAIVALLMIIFLVTYLFGFFSADIYGMLTVIFLLLILVFFIVNLVIHYIIKKKTARDSFKTLVTSIVEKTDSGELHYSTSIVKLNKLYKFAMVLVILFLILVVGLFASALQLSIKANEDSDLFPILLIL